GTGVPPAPAGLTAPRASAKAQTSAIKDGGSRSCGDRDPPSRVWGRPPTESHACAIVCATARAASRRRPGAMTFCDRSEAGRLLGEQLVELGIDQPIVLGLPRGGIPVAYEVAKALGAPLDVFVARKVGAPGHEEFGI